MAYVRSNMIGRFLDSTYETHPAVSSDGNLVVVGKVRDADENNLTGLKNGHALGIFTR